MKTLRIAMLGLLILCISAGIAMAQVPDVNAAVGNVCTGITVTPAFNASTQQMMYSITIAPDATFNGESVLGIKGLAVYPNGGASSTIFPNMGNVVATKPNWSGLDYNGAPGVNGFGFQTAAPIDYVLPSGISTEIGWAIYNSGLPSNPIYLVHIASVEGKTGFCEVGGETPPVPEPATMALLIPGLLPLAGILRKKRS